MEIPVEARAEVTDNQSSEQESEQRQQEQQQTPHMMMDQQQQVQQQQQEQEEESRPHCKYIIELLISSFLFLALLFRSLSSIAFPLLFI